MRPRRFLIPLGALALLLVIFGVPAVLVPVSMDNIPERSRIKVLTVHQQAIGVVADAFARDAHPEDVPGRLMPLPEDSRGWIEMINPMGRKAPGGGFAILPEADDQTGAIGVRGDRHTVVVTLPAFGGLERRETVITAKSAAAHREPPLPSAPESQ